MKETLSGDSFQGYVGTFCFSSEVEIEYTHFNVVFFFQVDGALCLIGGSCSRLMTSSGVDGLVVAGQHQIPHSRRTLLHTTFWVGYL